MSNASTAHRHTDRQTHTVVSENSTRRIHGW